jgi:WD40 repeat protein
LALLLAAYVVVTAQRPELVVQTGHAQSVRSLAFNSEGTLLASVGNDNTIIIWNLRTGQVIRTFKGHNTAVTAVAFSRDGTLLATVSHAEYLIKLWDIGAARELWSSGPHRDGTWRFHGNQIHTVAFSPDGSYLAVGKSEDEDMEAPPKPPPVPLPILRREPGESPEQYEKRRREYEEAEKRRREEEVRRRYTVDIWGVKDGQKVRELSGHTDNVRLVAFNKDGTLISGSEDRSIKIWDVGSGKPVREFKGLTGNITHLTLSKSGRLLACILDGGYLNNRREDGIRIWDLTTGQEVQTFSVGDAESVAFGPDEKTLLSISYNRIESLDIESGAKSPSLIEYGDRLLTEQEVEVERSKATVGTGRGPVVYTGDKYASLFSPDGDLLATSFENSISVWNWEKKSLEHRLESNIQEVKSFILSPDGKALAFMMNDYKNPIIVMNLLSGKTFVREGNSIAFSPDGKTLAYIVSDLDWEGSKYKVRYLLKLLNVEDGTEKGIEVGAANSLAYSPSGRFIATTGSDGPLNIWDVQAGGLFKSLGGLKGFAHLLTFDPDERGIWLQDERVVKHWSFESGLTAFQGNFYGENLTFSKDGKWVAFRVDYPEATHLVNLQTRQHESLERRSPATVKRLLEVVPEYYWNNSKEVVSLDGTWEIVKTVDGRIRFHDLQSGSDVADLIPLRGSHWAVVTPDGRFDAPQDAQRLMHYVYGLDVINLEQLKERYYEPELLRKLLGFSKEPLRPVARFEAPKLYPDVKYQPLAPGETKVKITLTNRGGGIGPVQVFVNDKEFLPDARDERLKKNSNVAQATVTVDLSKSTAVEAGKVNKVRVVAWNVENYIASRGAELTYFALGNENNAPPEVYAIIGGVSDYAGSQLRLNFAAKDAVDMANAIELGARRLFGALRVHLTVLSTAEDERSIAPTKANFIRAFESARKAKPGDILIVYLSGHGVALQKENSTYCYLTQEARTTDSATLSDPAVLKATTITSEELTEWVKTIPAKKQVIILDTCAAGAAQTQFRLVDKREMSGDAIRALYRTQGRTGSYILMGSAADASSYEASQYGQGLLTYSLLKGMNGPALKDDEFVDVSNLFQYARDEVEQLAKDIGGIQKPIVFSPRGDSFNVGQLTREDKQRIPVSLPKPLVLRPRFFDADVGDDTLDLMKTLRAFLRDETFAGPRGGADHRAFIFVDDEDFPRGIRPAGRYTIKGDVVNVEINLRKEGVTLKTVHVEGSKSDVNGLARGIIEAIKAEIK